MNHTKQGKVWLVGAGPSDPGLFTLKGREVLAQAEFVAYDALVGASVLAMIPEGAETVYVGKRAGNHAVPQEEISALLLQKAREGKRVVRLKGGDPFVFGRGGEELELLAREKIPYEVVPGVTSAFAVPAYMGIPVTHRDYASSVHVITGHRRAGFQTEMDFEALVRVKGTLVFLMGAQALGEICGGLLRAGMRPDTPAALLMQGTAASQEKILATVGTLEEKAEKHGKKTPAIIVVGEVCRLSETFSWYENQPLGGIRVLLARPKERISETAKKLRALGADLLEAPAVRIETIEQNERLYRALDEIASYQWLVFTSPSGVRVFFEELAKKRMDVRSLAALKIAVIGSGTKKELEKYGMYADLMPEEYDAAHLGQALAKECSPGDKILIARSAIGSPELTEALRAADSVHIDDIPTYQTVYAPHPLVDVRAEAEQGRIDYVLFTSASTVRGFAAAAQGADFTNMKAVCIGRQTAAEAEKLGMRIWISDRAAIDSLVEKLLEVCR